MTLKHDTVVRLPEASLEHFKKGVAYESNDVSVSKSLGLLALGAVYSEVPPGKSGCPFHVHHVEDELFVIIEGEGEYRFGKDVFAVRAGDVLGAPCGGSENAHKLTNTGQGLLKYLSISSQSDVDVCEYPDSSKFLVSSRRNAQPQKRFQYIGRQSATCDYWEGEQGAQD